MPQFLVTITHKIEQTLQIPISSSSASEAEKQMEEKLKELSYSPSQLENLSEEKWELQDEEFEITDVEEE